MLSPEYKGKLDDQLDPIISEVVEVTVLIFKEDTSILFSIDVPKLSTIR